MSTRPKGPHPILKALKPFDWASRKAAAIIGGRAISNDAYGCTCTGSEAALAMGRCVGERGREGQESVRLAVALLESAAET